MQGAKTTRAVLLLGMALAALLLATGTSGVPVGPGGGAANRTEVAALQATWLPVSYNCGSAESVASTLQRLKSEGVRRVYVAVWNQGVVYMQSPTMTRLMGANSAAQGRDILRWALDGARPLGMEVFAWFEYGLMCSYNDLSNAFASTASRKGWVLGKYNSFYWMDPGQADVANFLTGLLLDAVDGYKALGLKGVQLDDHFGTPVGLGGTASEMNTLAKNIYTAVKARGSVYSLSPSILSLSKGTYQADWNLWGSNRWFDEVLPQLYRSDYASYKSIFDETLRSISATTRSYFLAAGVRVDGTGSPTPWPDVNSMIQYSKANGVGNSIWYARGILELYPQYFGTTW